jgi:hypothetical protein
VDVFEEGDQGDEFLVLDITLPGLENDCVFGLLLDV